jgi:hypothetical protein
MNIQTPQEVKYTFVCDLAVYLTCIILNNIPKEDHQIAIEKIMNNWSQRIEQTRIEILKKLAPQLAQDQGMEVDVAAVIIDAHNVEGKMLKGEVKKEIRELMLKTIVAPQAKREPVRKKIMGG